MRKFFLLLFLLPWLTFAAVSIDWERKYTETGFDLGVGFSNTIFALKDVLYSDGVLDIDLKALPKKDLVVALNGRAEMFYNALAVPVINVGIFTGIEIASAGVIPSRLVDLLINSYSGALDSSLSLGGSVIWDTGLRLKGEFKKWKLEFSPAFYTPLIYVPWSQTRVNADKNSSFISLDSHVDIYSPGVIRNSELKATPAELSRATGFNRVV